MTKPGKNGLTYSDAGVDIATPVIGAPLAIHQPEGTQPWWRAE